MDLGDNLGRLPTVCANIPHPSWVQNIALGLCLNGNGLWGIWIMLMSSWNLHTYGANISQPLYLLFVTKKQCNFVVAQSEDSTLLTSKTILSQFRPSQIQTTYFYKIHPNNITHPFLLGLQMCIIFIYLSKLYRPMYFLSSQYELYIDRPPPPLILLNPDHSNNIRWSERITKLLDMWHSLFPLTSSVLG
jgi:hypothetical protein